MVLEINHSRKEYKEFYGKNIEQMPKLIADKRVLMNVSQLMQKRLDVRNSDLKKYYLDNYFDTGDAIFTEGKRRFDYDNMMGVYSDPIKKDNLELITLSILGLELGSDAELKPRYDLPVSRFIGITPEMLSALGKDASNRYTKTDLQNSLSP